MTKTNSKPITPERLKKIREEDWEMNQAGFAKLLGVSLRTYERWELPGKTVPDAAQAHIHTLNKLREMFRAGKWTKTQHERWAGAFPILQED